MNNSPCKDAAVTEPTEDDLREKVGIPKGARRVIIFGESSHWDPNWLLTSEGYYRLRIRRILDRALRELTREPRRVYSIECVFFLRMYWDRNPDKRTVIRDLVNQGRLRLTGSGITTPDTVLPDLESILRDYLLGQAWLVENGMTQRPRLAYFPDSFGHSPALPSILTALGFDMAAVTRLDGAWFPGCDYRRRRDFPLPGSSAEVLQRDLRSADFVWQGPDGSEVLCHWNPFTYGQGDTLNMIGPVKLMGLYLGIPSRSPRRVASRIAAYSRRLEPLARTPYMFCPIGFDFNSPIPRLLDLLDAFNRSTYPETGLYAVNAALDDYLILVSCHRDRLPVLPLDPNPYWTGFYSSRPWVKRAHNALCRDLAKAEKLLVLNAHDKGMGTDVVRDLRTAWEKTAAANHHDFITGTSPRRVWEREQRPWLREARDIADRALKAADRRINPSARPSDPPRWSLEDGRLSVETDLYRIIMDEGKGGCITSWTDIRTGREVLTGPGNDLISYKDTGGLWRMGHEFRGGTFREVRRASNGGASIRAREENGALTVSIESELEGRPFLRRMWFRSHSALVKMSVLGSAGRHRTITCRFSAALALEGLDMDVPGGMVRRPLTKLYTPTFWAARSFAHITDSHEPFPGFAVFMGGPAAVSAAHSGTIEWVVLRNAPGERAFGFLMIPAFPVIAADPEEHEYTYAVAPTPGGDWLGNRLHLLADEALSPPAAPARMKPLVTTDSEDVKVIAVKPAWIGHGIIIRLQSFNPSLKTVTLRCDEKQISRVILCDAREKDIRELPVSSGTASIPLRSSIVSLRIHR